MEEERETSTDQGKASQTTQDEKEEFVPKKGTIFVMCHVDILWIFHLKMKPTKQCNEITRCVAHPPDRELKPSSSTGSRLWKSLLPEALHTRRN